MGSCRQLARLLVITLQVLGAGAEADIRHDPRRRVADADRRRGCDRSGQRRKDLQERAPDRQAAADMLPLATRPAGIYLAADPPTARDLSLSD